MARSQILLILLAFIAVGCNAKTASDTQPSRDEYDDAIDSFALGTPDSETDDAVELIESAGVDAFRALIARLDDETDACDRFMGSVGFIGPGPHKPYHPPIGGACFDILQGQIEGVWPKGYRQYHVLNHSNIQKWLEQRKNKILNELQMECARVSLDTAKQKHEQNPSDWTKSCVEFLTDNLQKVQTKNRSAR